MGTGCVHFAGGGARCGIEGGSGVCCSSGPPAHQVLLFCPKAKPESFCPVLPYPALAVFPRLINRLPAKATPC